MHISVGLTRSLRSPLPTAAYGRIAPLPSCPQFQRAFRALGLKKRSGVKVKVDQAMFDSFDTNKDGMISIAEFEENPFPKTCVHSALRARTHFKSLATRTPTTLALSRHNRWLHAGCAIMWFERQDPVSPTPVRTSSE